MKFDEPKYCIIADPHELYCWRPVCISYGRLRVFDTKEEAEEYAKQLVKEKYCKDYFIEETWDDYCYEE